MEWVVGTSAEERCGCDILPRETTAGGVAAQGANVNGEFPIPGCIVLHVCELRWTPRAVFIHPRKRGSAVAGSRSSDATGLVVLSVKAETVGVVLLEDRQPRRVAPP